MAYDICSKNGMLIPLTEATMSVTSIEFAYGFGVYENIRIVKGTALFLKDHLERLERSAAVIGLTHNFKTKDIGVWTLDLVNACNSDALNIKMLLIGGKTQHDTTLFILPLAPLFPDRKLWKTGASAVTTHYERSFPDAKTLSMLGSYVAYRKAKEVGAYDALLIDQSGCITEGTRTNFFVLHGHTIIGAPEGKILHGVTMKHMLTVACTQGFSYVQKSLAYPEILVGNSAFLTSTSSKIMPLSRIDDIALPLSQELKDLMRIFDKYLDSAED